MNKSLTALLGVLVLTFPACMSGDGRFGLPSGWCGADEFACDDDPAVKTLIHEVNHVEHHIDKYGRITTKTPAIWGEARLMKHRQEFERQMEAQLNTFDVSLNGYLARSDQAFAAQALSLSAAFSGQIAQYLDGSGKPFTTLPTNYIQAPTINNNNPATLVPGITPASPSNPPAQPSATPPTTANNTNVFQSQPFALLPDTKPFTGFSAGGATLEPTVKLDQRARFLNHLHEIRRINEGDDTSDSPGYALYLVRVPVSVIPGKCTRTGHGAEITMSINAQYGDELLPKTFRNLVLNDLVDMLSLPVYEYVQGVITYNAAKFIKDKGKEAVRETDNEKIVRLRYGDLTAMQKAEVKKMMPLFKNIPADQTIEIPQKLLDQLQEKAEAQKKQAYNKVSAGRASVSNGRRGRQALPPSQVGPVLDKCIQAAGDYALALKDNEEFNAGLILDINKLISAELGGAYDLMSQHEIVEHVWTSDHPKGLATAIRMNEKTNVDKYHAWFNTIVRGNMSSLTRHLAWAILVESALLNERLVEDMKEVATEKNCACLPNDVWLPFYGPNPPTEARQAFQGYVACRWPTHVFALDPVTQDENIADTYSRRRETQFAMALAFASGRMSASSFSRFSRRLESDMATIALHRTAVGFAQGANHFGWRFYPRFQTPPVESNLTVLARDLVLGGPSRDSDLRKTQIEPGMRECVALVIMPSFVSNVTIDTRSHWFALANPKHISPGMKETMRLSEAVQRIENCASTLHGSTRYRPGEAGRLLRRVEQLSAELPMQSFAQQMPFENTLGGFAMFNSGMTDLAPQLHGYYGEPGIKLGTDTTLILVGNHFSVHETQVIAGNRRCEFSLLSRRIMRVTIPGDVQPVVDKSSEEKNVDIHVITPYGVTGHLQVPIVNGSSSSSAKFSWAVPTKYRATYTFKEKAADLSTTFLMPPANELVIKAPPGLVFTSTTAKLHLILSHEDRGVITGIEVDINYEVGSNRFVVFGNGLKGANDGLKAALKDYLEKNALPPAVELNLTGRLTLGATVLTTVESKIQLTLVKQ